MPYIKQSKRLEIDSAIKELPIDDAGDLNFVFTRIIQQYLKGKIKYQHVNDIIGALESAKFEFYRRVVSDYEDNKIEENGDIY